MVDTVLLTKFLQSIQNLIFGFSASSMTLHSWGHLIFVSRNIFLILLSVFENKFNFILNTDEICSSKCPSNEKPLLSVDIIFKEKGKLYFFISFIVCI